MSILVTGGAGYIGSHTVVELLNNNEDVIVVDNFSNSNINSINNIKKICNKDFKFYELDILDADKMENIFKDNDIESVIHFAGFKSVNESIQKPIDYYYNNVCSTLVLLELMKKYNCFNFVFSSSAVVYGVPKVIPPTEDFELLTTNPYGTTKLMIEQILKDVSISDPNFSVALLRYFNPIGAHESGLIGENPNGIPNNLMPYILGVAEGKYEFLNIFGNDYDTKDGTGLRDFIHVMDLADGHINALRKVRNDKGVFVYNLGTGKGYTVLELVNTFEKVNNIKISYKFVDRRQDDIPALYADASKAEKELGWKAKRSMEDMCRDSWNYILKNKLER